MSILWRFRQTFAVVSLLGMLFPNVVSAGSSQYFPETTQTSSNAFYEYWLAHGQAEILGLPLSPVYRTSDANIVQIYERAIMEWHPENIRENRVLLRLLGVPLLDGTVANGATETLRMRFASVPPRACGAGSNCETFDATNHTLLGVFRTYWSAHGGLATFGYPLTEEWPGYSQFAPDQTYIVQIFERARFEWHPEVNGGTVLLGRLGASFYDRAHNTINASNTVQVPDYDTPVPFLPAP